MLCMLCLYSCKKQFSLEESITILKDNDWTVTDSVRDMSEITNSLITYAEIHNVELNINVMLDYVCLTAPDRIQPRFYPRHTHRHRQSYKNIPYRHIQERRGRLRNAAR